MSVRLVRQSSETPNISNRDDTCMIRYAYGGYDGVVKNFGTQLSASLFPNLVGGGVFLIVQSGRIVLQGWEVDIDSESIEIQSYSSSSYDYLYLEVDLLLETASLKTVRTTDPIFPLETGSDLTNNTSGTARLPLYRWRGSASVSPYDLTQLFSIIGYAKEKIFYLEERLNSLGFKSGVATVVSGSASFEDITGVGTVVNTLNKQGKYCIMNAVLHFPIFTSVDESSFTLAVSDEFRPKVNTVIMAHCSCSKTDILGGTSSYYDISVSGIAQPDGNIVFSFKNILDKQNLGINMVSTVNISNAGWELP